MMLLNHLSVSMIIVSIIMHSSFEWKAVFNFWDFSSLNPVYRKLQFLRLLDKSRQLKWKRKDMTQSHGNSVSNSSVKTGWHILVSVYIESLIRVNVDGFRKDSVDSITWMGFSLIFLRNSIHTAGKPQKEFSLAWAQLCVCVFFTHTFFINCDREKTVSE